jgi:hypothetical protein
MLQYTAVKLVIVFIIDMAKVKDFLLRIHYAVSNCKVTASCKRICMCTELQKSAEERAMTYFKVQCKISPGIAK